MRSKIGIVVILNVVMTFGVILGCGQKPETEPRPTSEKSEVKEAPAAEHKPATKPLMYDLDPTKLDYPGAMVTGLVSGMPFTPQVLVEGDNLVFRTQTQEGAVIREIRITMGQSTTSASFDNRKLTISPEQPNGPEVPEIMVSEPNRNLQLYPNGYALKIELGSRQNWKIPGKIYLCLPDELKTVVAGVFEASYPRQPTEPPGPEDKPYIKGTVRVIGAPAKSKLRVGYTAHPSPEDLPLGETDIELGETALPLRWTRDDHDKGRVTTLIAGDGKDVPSRFEFGKLTPGKYFVFATVTPANSTDLHGPAAWKWVTVNSESAVSVDMTIDLTQTGGLEVLAPVEAVTNAQLAPADETGMPALDRTLFITCALQLRLEKPIMARKILYKNLTPGKYEVCAGGQSRIVEIVAGKTIELEFDKKTSFAK